MKANLRTRLLLPTIGSVIVCMGLSSYFSSQKAAEELWRELLVLSGTVADEVSKGLDDLLGNLRAMTALQAGSEKFVKLLTADDASGETLQEAIDALQAVKGVSGFIEAATIYDVKGNMVTSHTGPGKFNVSEREYFRRAVAGEAYISDPLMSKTIRKPVVVIAAPVRHGGRTLGVLVVGVDLGLFSESMVDPVRIGEGGYAYVVDGKGRVVCHQNKQLILEQDISAFDWGRRMLSMGGGKLSYSFEGQERTDMFAKLKTTGWLVGTSVSAADIAKATGAVRNASLYFGVAGILLVSLAVLVVVNQMLGALKQCVSFAGEVANGDLENTLNLGRKDELGHLGESLSIMVGKLRAMIETARHKTAEAEEQTAVARQAVAEAEEARRRAETARLGGMIEAAGTLEGVVTVATTASGELSGVIRNCSDSSEQQAASINEAATAMEEMNATILEVARNSTEAAETASQARDKAVEGARVVGQVVAGIGQVEAQAQEMKDDMNSLGRQAEGIGRILNVISDIADQTNLLALNAAIEAARAGDAGRGFAVVADEVRKLAEKTMQATQEVGEAISGVQQGTQKNVRNVERSVKTIGEATALAGQSGQTLAEIVSMVERAADQVRSIATAAEEQSTASEEITRNVETINQISQDVADSIRHASHAVSEVAEQTQVLRTLVDQLKGGEDGAAALPPGGVERQRPR